MKLIKFTLEKFIPIMIKSKLDIRDIIIPGNWYRPGYKASYRIPYDNNTAGIDLHAIKSCTNKIVQLQF